MSVIVQLSDLHLLAYPKQREETLVPLVEAASQLRAQMDAPPALLTMTGDVFDSADTDPRAAVRLLEELYRELCGAFRSEVPLVILPGNHDRRKSGFVGPQSRVLFDAIHSRLAGKAQVAGCQTPFLCQLVPPSFHKLPVALATYDSTYLPHGWLSAGGFLRQDDLLEMADSLQSIDPALPLLLLTHHHVVPTPLTDMSRVDAETNSATLRFVVRELLARIVANGEREELTMTALGAGTALSTLQSLNRAVMILHGHKHYPAARALAATAQDQGDLLVVGAGSAGTVLTWTASEDPERARLWPSFNVIEFSDDRRVVVDVLAFSPKDASNDPRLSLSADHNATHGTTVVRRPLLRATQDGPRWVLDPIDSRTKNMGPVLAENRAIFRISRSLDRPSRRYDLHCERVVRDTHPESNRFYGETVELARDARIAGVREGSQNIYLPADKRAVRIPVDGTPLTYTIHNALCRTNDELVLAHDALTAYEGVELLNRYECRDVLLTVEGLPPTAKRAFGSATDLTTGQERPVTVERETGRAVLRYVDCPPRTRLRIRWRVQ